MTGILVVDLIIVIAFAVTLVVALLRFANGQGGRLDRLESGFHVLMAAAMVAMSWPSGGAMSSSDGSMTSDHAMGSAGAMASGGSMGSGGMVGHLAVVGVFGIAALCWATVLVRLLAATHASCMPRATPASHFAASIVMVAAAYPAHAAHGAVHAAGHVAGPSVWPLVGAAFVVYVAWVVTVELGSSVTHFHRRRDSDRPSRGRHLERFALGRLVVGRTAGLVCSVVMGSGMAAMAFTM